MPKAFVVKPQQTTDATKLHIELGRPIICHSLLIRPLDFELYVVGKHIRSEFLLDWSVSVKAAMVHDGPFVHSHIFCDFVCIYCCPVSSAQARQPLWVWFRRRREEGTNVFFSLQNTRVQFFPSLLMQARSLISRHA